jgi:hypothetical protein
MATLAMLTSQFAILQAPPGPWRKVTAFGIGVAAALSLNAFLVARPGPSRPTDLAAPPHASASSGPMAASAPTEVTPPEHPENAGSAPAAAPAPAKAAPHKAGRATKRHPPKRRSASKH